MLKGVGALGSTRLSWALRRLALALVLIPGACLGTAQAEEDLSGWAESVLDEHFRRMDRAEISEAAEFPSGLEWLNVTRPLTWRDDLRGRVVLLDFWCYCCINCLHVLPDLEALEQRYASEAFAVVGVHSAKFTQEEDIENVREAVRRHSISHSVVNDEGFAIWREYGARAWPTLVLVLPDGTVLGRLSGEGHRAELDALIKAALKRYKALGQLRMEPLPLRLERSAMRPSQLAYPGKLLADAASGRLYVSDSRHHRVLELDLDGAFVRAFGSGERGFGDGPAATARFRGPQGLALLAGSLYVADTENHAIRRIDLATGQVSTVAGTGEQARALWLDEGASAPGLSGPVPGRIARLSSPWDLEPAFGGLIVAMAGSHQLWRLDPGTGAIEWFSGDGSERRRDEADPRKAAYAQPSGLAFDGTHLYVADSESSAILRVDAQGGVVTLAGGSARPEDLFHFGDEDGVGRGRRFQHPLGVVRVDSDLIVADTYNNKLKRVNLTSAQVTTWIGTGETGLGEGAVRFFEPGGISRAGDTLYVADTNHHAIRAVALATGATRTLALTGVPIPQARLREHRANDPWADLPDTIERDLGSVAVAADQDLTLDFSLYLPPGWKLDDATPSALQVTLAGQAREEVKMQGVVTQVSLGRLPPGEHPLVLRLLYFPCQASGTCRMQSTLFRALVRAGEGAEPRVRVREAFRP